MKSTAERAKLLIGGAWVAGTETFQVTDKFSGAVIGEADRTVPVIAVRATRGKWLRAEPVAALYAEGRVVHVGDYPALEEQMCAFGADGLARGRSPDRLDALVWALTDLMIGAAGKPGIRRL